MNYFEYLNKRLSSESGQPIAQNILTNTNTDNNNFVSYSQNPNENTVKINDTVIFEKVKQEDFDKMDYNNILSTDDTKTLNLTSGEYVLRTFFSIDKIRTLADDDHDGTISVDEAKDYIKELAGKDGNITDISFEDFEKVIQENEINLETLKIDYTNADTFGNTNELSNQNMDTFTPSGAAQNQNVDNNTPIETIQNQNVNNNTPVKLVHNRSSHSSGSYSSGYRENIPKTLDTMSIAELEAEKTKRIQTLQEKQTAVNAVHNGQNQKVKDAKAVFDNAKAEYEKAIKSDTGAKKFANDIIKNNKAIETNEENLNKNAIEIADTQLKLSNTELSLADLNNSLKTLNGVLSSIPALSGKPEDKEKDTKINEKKNRIKQQISSKKSEISKAENTKEKQTKHLTNLENKKTRLEDEKQKLKNEKTQLDLKVKQYCTEETKSKLDAFNKAKNNLETVKNQELTNANEKLQTAKNRVKEVNDKLSAKKAEQIKNQASGSALKPGLFKGRLAEKEALVTEISRKYGVDPALVASIIALESGWGTSYLAQHNNFGGYRKAGDAGVNAKGFGYFSTPEKGLDAMIRNLASYERRFSDVKAVDFDNLDAIGRHYCEGGRWSRQVRDVYNTRVRHYIV